MHKYSLYIFLIISGGLFSCGDSKEEKHIKMQKTIDRQIIRDYLNDNGLAQMADSTGTGLFLIIEEEGGAEKPGLSNEVVMDYTGKYADDVKFDSSYDAGKVLRIGLSSLIPGWQEGIPFFGRGGKGKLLIPSHLGYGPNPANGIRNDAVLIFDIELHDFN